MFLFPKSGWFLAQLEGLITGHGEKASKRLS